MINISITYMKKDGCRFDLDYYLNIHMPRSIELLSSAKGFKNVYVEKATDVESFNIVAKNEAVCNYYFESLEDFTNAFIPHMEELTNDISNYTDIEPIIQVNEVEINL